MKLNATISVDKEVQIDCFGCDSFHDKTVTIKEGFLGIGKKTELKFYCAKLFKGEDHLELTSYQANAYNMQPSECPCKFLQWSQTNTDYEITEDVFKLTLRAGCVLAEPVMAGQLDADDKTKQENKQP